LSVLLTVVDASARWNRVATIWDIRPGCWWYPLDTDTTRPDVLALEATADAVHKVTEVVRQVLQRRGVQDCLEFPEFSDQRTYQLAVTELDLNYQDSERFWTDDPYDWIVYSSHESSLTLGGTWLIADLKSMWPDWGSHLWRCGDPAFVHRST